MKLFKSYDGVVPLLWVSGIGLILSVCAFGAEFDPPIWLKPIVDIILGVPVIGPFLLGLLKWTGIIAAVMTALSGGLMLVAKSLEKMGTAMGLVKFAATVKSWYDKIFPIVAWFSMFNVLKKK